jgi:integrase/recombinase XerD
MLCNSMKTEKPFNILIADFLSEQSVTQNSIRTYNQMLKNWVHFCISQKIDIRQPRKADVIFFKNYLMKTGKAINTVNLNVTVLKMFFSWLKQNSIYSNITEGIRNVRNDNRHLKKYLKEDQVNRLLNSIPFNDLEGMRDYCLIMLMVTTGLRRAEIARLKYKNIIWHQTSLEPPLIKIYRKGNEFHSEFSLSEEIIAPIIEYINYRHRRENISTFSPLFISLSKNSYAKQLQPGSISRIVKTRLSNIGINDPKITAHSLRHTAAIIALKHKVDLFAVSRMLGHRSIETTRIYLNAMEEELVRNNPAVQELGRTFQNKVKKGQKTPLFYKVEA